MPARGWMNGEPRRSISAEGAAGDEGAGGIECAEFAAVGSGVFERGTPDFQGFDLRDGPGIKSGAEGRRFDGGFAGRVAGEFFDEMHG